MSLMPGGDSSGQVVIDAGVVISFAIQDEPHHQQARRLIMDLDAVECRLYAPPLFESETDSVIRRRVYLGNLTLEGGQVAQVLVDALQIIIIHDPRVRHRARQLAEQLNQVRVYDSTYIALAELLGCDLWTDDERLYNSVRTVLNFVRFLGDY